jgi:hypothetical protein
VGRADLGRAAAVCTEMFRDNDIDRPARDGEYVEDRNLHRRTSTTLPSAMR